MRVHMGGVPYQAHPCRMQFSRILSLFDPFEAFFDLAPEVKINAKYFFTSDALFLFLIFNRLIFLNFKKTCVRCSLFMPSTVQSEIFDLFWIYAFLFFNFALCGQVINRTVAYFNKNCTFQSSHRLSKPHNSPLNVHRKNFNGFSLVYIKIWLFSIQKNYRLWFHACFYEGKISHQKKCKLILEIQRIFKIPFNGINSIASIENDKI